MARCEEEYQCKGYVGNEKIEVRETKDGRKVANISLYLNFYVKREGQEKREKIERIRDVAIFGKAAESAARDLKKGMFIGVRGTPVADSYENKKGERKNYIKINTNSYENYGFLPKKETEAAEAADAVESEAVEE